MVIIKWKEFSLRESDNVQDYVQLIRVKCQVSVQANQSSKMSVGYLFQSW